MAAIYTVCPVKGATLLPGETLLVTDPFPARVRLVLLRRLGEYDHAGYVEGEGVEYLREAGVQALTIRSVSEVSGCGQAVDASPGTGD